MSGTLESFAANALGDAIVSPVSHIHECVAVFITEEDGGFSAYLANLRGVHSEGETFAEAIANIRDAAQATVARYAEKQLAVPWHEIAELPQGALVRRILINV